MLTTIDDCLLCQVADSRVKIEQQPIWRLLLLSPATAAGCAGSIHRPSDANYAWPFTQEFSTLAQATAPGAGNRPLP